MKDPNLAEQEYTDTRSFALADFGTKFPEKRLYVLPADRTADRSGEYLFQSSLVPAPHESMVL